LAGKSGSKATPRRPRSPEEFTDSVTKGVARRAPFFTTRRLPPWRHTNKRPSGAIAMAVGLASVPVRLASVKPEGKVAPESFTGKPTARTPRRADTSAEGRRAAGNWAWRDRMA
jgi:hypothetical protein